MTPKKFIEQNKIKPSIAAGFMDHLRMEPDSESSEEKLSEAFKKFTGVAVEHISKPRVDFKPEKKTEIPPKSPEGFSGDNPGDTDKGSGYKKGDKK
ncbi:MAG: hypothetical protein K8R21_13695 [Leptospira sp.]|nr:hypothetical protein [Leptospira sp.]